MRKHATRLARSNPRQRKTTGQRLIHLHLRPATKDELATQQQQSKALGLNGDTSKNKKKNPSKEGPKRRMSDEKKPAAPAFFRLA